MSKFKLGSMIIKIVLILAILSIGVVLIFGENFRALFSTGAHRLAGSAEVIAAAPVKAAEMAAAAPSRKHSRAVSEEIFKSERASEKSLGTSASLGEAGAQRSGEVPSRPQPAPKAGILTAGEWSDLDNWDFWNSRTKDFSKYSNDYWGFSNDQRILVHVSLENGSPAIDVPVDLKTENGSIVWKARTDNQGRAELWNDCRLQQDCQETSRLRLIVSGLEFSDIELKEYEKEYVNRVILKEYAPAQENLDIAFIVDATGSMTDELEFLKKEFIKVLERIKQDNMNSTISTASVFYRDHGDDYVTHVSGFVQDISKTNAFIQEHHANGGGDYPEAVDEALYEGIGTLKWSESARARLLFLVLDAPPHQRQDVIERLQSLIASAAEKGIRIIPVVGSGIDKDTEFLMRYFAIRTNGTYVFITDDSGVGGSHLKPTIGTYNVEYLNDLIVRLINKYMN